VTIALVPTRTASRVPRVDPTATAAATGSRWTPEDSGLYARMNWKNCVIRKMNPSSVKNAMVTEALAALKRMSLKSRTSSIGSAARRSPAMNAISRRTAPAKPASDAADVQPRSGASMMV
jgi:hypothetical protein